MIGYHLWGLFLIATTIGAFVLLVVLCMATGQHTWSIPLSLPAFWVILLVVGFAAIVYWIRWGYRRATEPFMRLQREVAVEIARKEIRRKMARKRRR